MSRARAHRGYAAHGALVVAAIASGATTAPTVTGCQTHLCDASCIIVTPEGTSYTCGAPASSARKVDAGIDSQIHVTPQEVIWETAPMDAPWILFEGNQTIAFNLPDAITCPPYELDPYLSIDNPAEAGVPHGNRVNSAGQLTEYVAPPPDLSSRQVLVLNNTCEKYFLRLVVHAWRDCTTDAGAAPLDAPADDGAPLDAPTDALPPADAGAPPADAALD